MAFKLDHRKKVIIGVIVAAVVLYFAYRWYQNRQAQQAASGTNTTGDGTNLNSVAPDMGVSDTGGSGLNYTSPAQAITINLPNGNPSVSDIAGPTTSTGTSTIPTPAVIPKGSPAPPTAKTPIAVKSAVPAVTGKTLVAAQALLTARGFKYSGPRGISAATKVKTQSPKAGTLVAKGSIVTVGV